MADDNAAFVGRPSNRTGVANAVADSTLDIKVRQKRVKEGGLKGNGEYVQSLTNLAVQSSVPVDMMIKILGTAKPSDVPAHLSIEPMSLTKAIKLAFLTTSYPYIQLLQKNFRDIYAQMSFPTNEECPEGSKMYLIDTLKQTEFAALTRDAYKAFLMYKITPQALLTEEQKSRYAVTSKGFSKYILGTGGKTPALTMDQVVTGAARPNNPNSASAQAAANQLNKVYIITLLSLLKPDF